MTNELIPLVEILREDFAALASPGDECDGYETVDQSIHTEHDWYTIINVVTKSPSGKLYRWRYSEGKTEHQESEYIHNPYGQPTPVRSYEEVVTITRYEVIR